MTLQKHFSHPSFNCQLLSKPPTYKTETGTANRWETTNSKPLGPIKLSTQSETTNKQTNRQSSQKTFDLTVFIIRLFPGLLQGFENCAFFSWSSGFTGFDESTSSKVSSESHMLSIGGDALTEYIGLGLVSRTLPAWYDLMQYHPYTNTRTRLV